MKRVAAAILAAGASRRLGQPKQLLPFRGTTLVRAITAEVCTSRCQRVGVIVGAHAAQVAATVADLPVAVVPNVLWQEGLAASIRCAVSWAVRSGTDALALLVCDQPGLTASHLDRLVAEHVASGRPVASRYADTVGVPAVFGASEFPQLFALTGDRGAQRVLGRTHARVVDWPEGACDIDTLQVARDVLDLEA